MAVGAAIGAAGSVVGGAVGGKGASKAADAQARAAEKQAEVQQQLGNRSIDVQIATFDEAQRKSFPWYVTGQSALSRYADAMGLARPAELDTEIRPIAGLIGTSYQQGATGQGGTGTGTAPATGQGGSNALAPANTGTGATGTGGDNALTMPALMEQTRFDERLGGTEEGQWREGAGMAVPWGALGPILERLSQPQQQAAPPANAAPNEQIDVTTEGSLPIPKDPSQLTLADFEASPDYQFRLDQGTKGVENALAARGMRLSGNALQELSRFNSGLASGEYGAFYGRKTQERNNYLAQLANLSGTGQAAVTNTNALGQSAAGNVANINQATAQGVGNALQAGGNARASGYIGQANAWGNALQGVGSSLGNLFGSQPAATNIPGMGPGGTPYFNGIY